MTNWGHIISDIMKEQRVSQRKLVLASGLSKSTVKRFLRGETRLRTDSLDRMLEALGYEIDLFKLGVRGK